jgi:hypothetical protein
MNNIKVEISDEAKEVLNEIVIGCIGVIIGTLFRK